jgi:hypothetical protein
MSKIVARLLDAYERDLSTSALLTQLESLTYDLLELDAAPAGWTFAEQNRNYIGLRLERLGDELTRRDALRHRPGAPPWPSHWRDAREVKQRIRLEQVVERYTPATLEPAGRELKCRCPFHDDATPSCFVNPTKQTWHCFSCQRGGDVIAFVMMFFDLDFSAALDLLAADAGLVAVSATPAGTAVARG